MTEDMSTRDVFAAAAIDRCLDIAERFLKENQPKSKGEIQLTTIAEQGVRLSYYVADIMMDERRK